MPERSGVDSRIRSGTHQNWGLWEETKSKMKPEDFTIQSDYTANYHGMFYSEVFSSFFVIFFYSRVISYSSRIILKCTFGWDSLRMYSAGGNADSCPPTPKTPKNRI